LLQSPRAFSFVVLAILVVAIGLVLAVRRFARELSGSD
jgi:hypothetical protein